MKFYVQIFFLLIYAFHHFIPVSPLRCYSYNDDNNNESPDDHPNDYNVTVDDPAFNSKIVTCSETSDAPHTNLSCYVVWSQRNGTVVNRQGCFPPSGSDCDPHERCIERGLGKKGHLFCCCLTDLCNGNFSWQLTSTVAPTTTEAIIPVDDDDSVTFYLAYVIFPMSMILLLLIMYLLKRKKLHQFKKVPNKDQLSQSSPCDEKLRLVKLDEMIARGKFGTVWKGTDENETVAVKIIPQAGKQSWMTEKEIYNLPLMTHDNILRLIAAEKRGDNLCPEFWLITAYHPYGSLHDFLKSNTITWEQFCRICFTMAKGVSHLHEEILPMKGDGYKPSIAHRDFKSSNVLLKNDFSACIADFGLALICTPQRTNGDHGQVGTARYMAPEVLEGAITFSVDSYLRIDIYAFGLILWELVSRCSFFYQDSVPEYKLPFEAEVGSNPTLIDMQEIVVQQRRRPVIEKIWYQRPEFESVYDTISECWDHDSEARVSASCITERFSEFLKPSDSTYSMT